MSWRLWLIALVAPLLLGTACGEDDGEQICAQIYDSCNGSLVDEQGVAVSREGCLTLMDQRAEEDAAKLKSIASCMSGKKCRDIAPCLAL